jgi:3-deoxy-D-manno-octulosonic acid kinase
MEHFVHIEQDRAHAIVARPWQDELRRVLFETGDASPMNAGRGDASMFEFAGGRGVIRRYRRGGLAQVWSRDAYFLVNRPLREWSAHTFLYESGFPVPEPLGVCWRRSGPWYRGAIATRHVEAADLGEFAATMELNRDAMLRRVGEIIRRMHDMGVYHADLQIHNILVAVDGIYVIDFDNARRGESVSRIRRLRNLLRLRRSCDKNAIPRERFDRIAEGYGVGSFPAWLDALYRAKARLSDAMV